MTTRLVATLIAGVLALALVLPCALAADVSVSVARSDGAEDCPDSAALSASVRALTAARGKSFHVRFGRADERYEARVDVASGGHGSREMSDSSRRCAPLAAAVATVIALMLDESTVATPGVAASPPAQAVPAASGPPSPEAPPVPPTARATGETRDPWRVWLAAGARINSGLVPGIGPALFADVTARAPLPFSIGAGGFWSPDEDASLPPGQVGIGLAGAWIRGCWRWMRVGGVHLWACGAPSVGQLRVHGSGFTDNAFATRLWTAVGGELEAEGAFAGRWGFLLRAGAVAPLQRQTAFVDGVGTAWRGPVVSPTLGAAVQAAIW